MRKIIAITALLVPFLATPAGAATMPEYRVLAGAYVPTGDMADVFESSMLVGMQGAVELNERFHFVASFGYATPKPKSFAFTNDVHLYQYDVGAELFGVYAASGENDHWTVRPFVGAGLGGRTYDFQDTELASHSDWGGYGSLGAELQHRNIAARLEARGYLSRFNGLRGNEETATRNDLVLGGGLSFHF